MNIKPLLFNALIFPSMILISSVAMAEIAYDEKTNKLYSKNASSDVNPDEYDLLASDALAICARAGGLVRMNPADLAVIFGTLRMKRTPAALRLIHDLEELEKNLIRRIHNL
jgi:hypothetical protein